MITHQVEKKEISPTQDGEEHNLENEKTTLSLEAKHSSITLTNGNTTAEIAGGGEVNAGVYCPRALSEGRHEWSVHLDQICKCEHGFGVGTDFTHTTFDTNGPSIGYNPKGEIWDNINEQPDKKAFASAEGDTIKVVLDCDEGYLQYTGKGGEAKVAIVKGKTYYPFLNIYKTDKWTFTFTK